MREAAGTAGGPYDLLVLSPHLDDAALSCGGRMAAAAGRGERVLLVTLFAAHEPPEPLSELARILHRGWKVPPGGVTALRRREDLDACRVLGVEPLHLELPEAPYRRHPASGAFLYRTPADLFRPPPEGEEATLDALVEALEGLPPAARVAAPLAVGGHVDHVLARAAAERRFGTALGHYEDFPYAAAGWLGLRGRRALAKALGPRHGWEPRTLALTEAHLAARCAAVACYRSQVPPLFRTAARMERAVRRHAGRVGGERLWRRRGPSGAG